MAHRLLSEAHDLRPSAARVPRQVRVWMFLACSLLPVLADAAVSPLFPQEGKPILSVRIEGGDDQDAAAVRSLLDVEAGYLFSSLELSRAIRRIYALGRFSDISVRVEPFADALELVVTVTAQERFGELNFEGDEDVEVKREMRALILPGQPFDPALLELLKRRCEKSWEQIGYFAAECVASAQPSSRRHRQDLTMRTRKNAPSKITRIAFTGTRLPPDWELHKFIALRVGKPLVAKQLKADERALRLAFFKRGFLNASVRAFAERNNDGHTVSFAIASGPRVSLKIAGNVSFSDSTLQGLAHRPADEALGRDVLDAWRRAVVAKYQSRGFSFVEAKVKSFYEAPRHILHYVLAIKEGPRTSIERLAFPGAKHFSAQRLIDETAAFVSEKSDASAFTSELNPNSISALEDGSVGLPSPPRIIPPSERHWLFREDPTKLLLPDAYRQALEAIRKLYLEQGFTRVEIGPMTVMRKELPSVADATPGIKVPERNALEISVPIKEGPRTMVSVLSFGGTQALSSEALLDLAKVSPGQAFSELLLEETRNAIQKALAQKGYLYARVDSQIGFSADLTHAEIRYIISDGPQVMVGRLLVQGNEETNEGVIGDRIALEPGQPYSPEQAQSTKDELTKLESFSSVQVGVSDPEVPAEQKDVLVKLIERNTFRTVDAGIGFSTTQGVRGYVELANKNLFGTAQQATARLTLNRQFAFAPIFYNQWATEMGTRYAQQFSKDTGAFLLQSIERQIRLSWRTPRSLKLPGRPQLYSELVNERLNTIPFSLDSTTFLVGTDTLPVSHLGLVLETSLSYNRLECFNLQAAPTDAGVTQAGPVSNCDPQNLGRVTQVVEGTFLNWKTGPTLLVDFRDDKLNPRAGFLALAKADFVLGEKVDLTADEKARGINSPLYGFVKAELQLTGYIPVGKRASFVLSASAGNIFRVFGDETLLRAQLNERYYLGGRNTLRGYPDRAVLPQDACVVAPDAPADACPKTINRVQYQQGQAAPIVPGSFKFVAKAEFRFPVVSDLMVGIFVDAGNLYFDAADFNPLLLRWNFGAGLRYQTGVGAIAIDVGFNPFFRPERGETVVAYPYIYFGLF